MASCSNLSCQHQSHCCTHICAGEGDVARLAARLAERDAEVFHHYSFVQQANLGIQDLDKEISESHALSCISQWLDTSL